MWWQFWPRFRRRPKQNHPNRPKLVVCFFFFGSPCQFAEFAEAVHGRHQVHRLDGSAFPSDFAFPSLRSPCSLQLAVLQALAAGKWKTETMKTFLLRVGFRWVLRGVVSRPDFTAAQLDYKQLQNADRQAKVKGDGKHDSYWREEELQAVAGRLFWVAVGKGSGGPSPAAQLQAFAWQRDLTSGPRDKSGWMERKGGWIVETCWNRWNKTSYCYIYHFVARDIWNTWIYSLEFLACFASSKSWETTNMTWIITIRCRIARGRIWRTNSLFQKVNFLHTGQVQPLKVNTSDILSGKNTQVGSEKGERDWGRCEGPWDFYEVLCSILSMVITVTDIF